MKLLILEKPAMLRSVRCGLEHYFPLDVNVDIVYTYSIGLWHFKIPKISFNQIPYTEKPTEYSPANTNTDYCHRYMHNGNNEELVVINKNDSKEDIVESLNLLIETIESRLPYYDEIIIVVDPDRTGAWGVNQIIEQLPKDKLPPIHALDIRNGLDNKSIFYAIQNREKNVFGNNSFMDEFAEKHKVKKYFDYWWYTNSKMVFSELCKWSGLKADVMISKYEFMLLNIIKKENNPIKETNLIKLMEKWQGTGKYDPNSVHGEIGSCMSRSSIVENAVKRGAIDKLIVGNDNLLKLSEKGRAFLSRVHNKTFDPDLPFRLEKWCESKDINAARRYVSTLFRRQFRYQRKQIKCDYMTNEIIKHFTRVHNLSSVINPNAESEHVAEDTFFLRTSDYCDAGTVTVTALQSGFYKVELKLENESYFDIVKSVTCGEEGLLTPNGWVKKYGKIGVKLSEDNEQITF